MKTIFLTGVNGLLGTNFVHLLLEKDFIIYALIRDKKKYKGRKNSKLKLITMDLFGDYENYLRKSDIVVHIAADTSTDKTDYEDYEKINFKATKRLFDFSTKNDIKRFIYISTANTIGYGSRIHPGKETDEIKEPFNQLFYAKSKAKAEKYLQQTASDIKVFILNPTFMIGAYDSKPSSGKIILMALNKPIVFYPPGGKNFVHVKDVAQAILNCFSCANSGERYLIAGENLSYLQFFKKVKEQTQSRQRLIPLPGFALFLFGIIGEGLRNFKLRTSLSKVNMKILRLENFYSGKKAEKYLSLSYTPIDQAIKDAVFYFQSYE